MANRVQQSTRFVRESRIADSQPLPGHSQASDGFEELLSQPPVQMGLLEDTSIRRLDELVFQDLHRSPIALPGIQSELGKKETEEPQPAGRKRAARKKVAEKAKKTKSVVEIFDSDGHGEEESGEHRWTDAEVRQLIAFRSEMDEQFRKNFLRGGRTWGKLRRRMVSGCAGFDKSLEACREKWEAVFAHYGIEKRLLLFSGERLEVRCKFFDEIDKGFSNSATVRKLVHSDGGGNANPCPVDL